MRLGHVAVALLLGVVVMVSHLATVTLLAALGIPDALLRTGDLQYVPAGGAVAAGSATYWLLDRFGWMAPTYRPSALEMAEQEAARRNPAL